jgi:tRNA (pseudouridine54-N1)-methyltransferase
VRTFILRARHGATEFSRLKKTLGAAGHFEIIAHCVMNAFFVSNGFRDDADMYLVLESTADFPRTLHLSARGGLSIRGFHEQAVLEIVALALRNGQGLAKDQTRAIAPGVSLSGFGFERLVNQFIGIRPLYLLDRKGVDIHTVLLAHDPIFILSDHLSMPKNTVKSLTRRGVQRLSLGKKMLFASQCVVLLNDAMDRVF